MAYLTIRTLQDGTSHYTQTVTLDGRLYVMNLDFSARDGYWYLSLADSDGVAIPGCVGRRLVANWQVLRSTDSRRPPGELAVVGGDDAPPGLASLGQGQTLLYIEATELGREVDHFGVG